VNEIQDVKEVFNAWSWKKRIEEDPRRIYAFLLCADEHAAFRNFVQDAWRTLDALSGRACDVFTLEHWVFPHERFKKRGYLPLPGGSAGAAGIAPGERYGLPGQQVAIDNGIMLPDRTQCFEVRKRLFKKPEDIILPGLAVFASPWGKESIYYDSKDLQGAELSSSFQAILGSIQKAYETQETSDQVLARFRQLERMRSIKGKVSKALLNLSLMDLVDLLKGGFGFVMPKSKQ